MPTKPLDSDRQRILVAKALLEAIEEHYGDRINEVCRKHSPPGTDQLVRVYQRVSATANQRDTTHAVRTLTKLMVLPLLASDAKLARTIRTIKQSGSVPGPDFAELSRPWANLTAIFASKADDDGVDAYGPIILVRDFCVSGASGRERCGLPGGRVNIQCVGTFELDPRIPICDGLQPPGANNKKYVLREIDIDASRDASRIEHIHGANILVAETDNHTVFRTDCFFHQENKKALYSPTLPKDLREATEQQRLKNRMAFGDLDPEGNCIPYQLTVFYTVVLNDEHVLLMRRSSGAVAYYPNTVEPSGGEQLDRVDLHRDGGPKFSAFERWVRRAVVEEYLPTLGLDARLLKEPAEELFDKDAEIYLQGVGFNVLDGSFPIFALVKLGMSLADYLNACEGLRLDHHLRPRWENEGRRGWVSRQALVEGFKQGEVKYVGMLGQGGEPEERHFNLTKDELHPMTLARLYFLWRSHEHWWHAG